MRVVGLRQREDGVGISILAWRGFVVVAVVEIGCAVSVSVEACWTSAGCSGVVTMSFSSVAGVTSI